MPTLKLLPLLIAALALTGCSTSRYAELRSQSNKVERALERERDDALRLPPEANLGQKLDHLTSLRYTLTAADLGLAAARRLLPEADRPLAYDALEQAYDTIAWNIPLLPGQGTRPMPSAFSGGVFNINQFMTPATDPVAPPSFAD